MADSFFNRPRISRTASVAFHHDPTSSNRRKKRKNIKATNSSKAIAHIGTCEDMTIDGAFPFVCEPCSKIFTGHIPHEQHLLSAEHLKKTQSENCCKEPIAEAFSCVCKNCDKKNCDKKNCDKKNCDKKNCDKKNCDKKNCDKKFTYEQHLASAVHLWKTEAEAVVAPKESSSAPPQPRLQSSEDVSMGDADLPFPFGCLACDKKFTGEKPYQQHLVSSSHAKKVNFDPNEVFSCDKCEVSFSGPIPYKQHLESLKHEMKIAGPAMASVLRTRHQLEHFEGGYRPEDIRCYGVDEPLGEEMFAFTSVCDAAQEVADREFLAAFGVLGNIT